MKVELGYLNDLDAYRAEVGRKAKPVLAVTLAVVLLVAAVNIIVLPPVWVTIGLCFAGATPLIWFLVRSSLRMDDIRSSVYDKLATDLTYLTGVDVEPGRAGWIFETGHGPFRIRGGTVEVTLDGTEVIIRHFQTVDRSA